jgi:hypothetical protein
LGLGGLYSYSYRHTHCLFYNPASHHANCLLSTVVLYAAILTACYTYSMLATILTSFSTVNLQFSRVFCFAKCFGTKFPFFIVREKIRNEISYVFLFRETSKISRNKIHSLHFVISRNKSPVEKRKP